MTDSMKFGPEWLRNMSNDSSGGGGGSGANQSNNSSNSNNTTTSSHNASTSSSAGMNSVGLNNNHHQPSSQFHHQQHAGSIYSSGIGAVGAGTNHSGGGLQHSHSAGSFSNNLAGGGYGGALTSSPVAPPRYQLADHRYGREEMLSLFDKNIALPEILPRFKKLFMEKIQLPLALMPNNEEEIVAVGVAQRTLWPVRSPTTSTSIATGRGGVRGGSLERGRGRGRGSYHSTALGFQRSTSVYDEDPRVSGSGIGGGSGIGVGSRTGWSDRNGLGSDGTEWNGSGSSPRKEYISRGGTQESWRKGGGRLDEEPVGGSNSTGLDGWRSGGGSSTATGFSKWTRSQSWREDGGEIVPNPNPASRYMMSLGSDRNSERGLGLNSASAKAAAMHARKLTPWEDDNLPEWAIEDPIEGGGSFDASGAFHGTEDANGNGASPPSPKDKRPPASTAATLERSKSSSEPLNGKDPSTTPLPAAETAVDEFTSSSPSMSSPSSVASAASTSSSPSPSITESDKDKPTAAPSSVQPSTQEFVVADTPTPAFEEPIKETTTTTTATNNHQASPSKSTVVPSSTPPGTNPSLDALSVDRMKSACDDMVKKLVMDDEYGSGSPNPPRSKSDNPSPYEMSQNTQKQQQQQQHVKAQQQQQQQQNQHPNAPNAINPAATNANVQPRVDPNNEFWFYRDPQGHVQGAFAAVEMAEWYRAGYFDENLFVRRACDTIYAALGDLVRVFGGVPFTSPHFIPPLQSIELVASLEAISAGQPPPFLPHLLVNNNNSGPHPQPNKQQQQPVPADAVAATIPPGSGVPTVGNQSAATAAALLGVVGVPGGPTVGNNPTPNEVVNALNYQLLMMQKQFLMRQQANIIQKLTATEPWSLLNGEQQTAMINQQMSMIAIPEYLLAPTAGSAASAVPTIKPQQQQQQHKAMKPPQQQQQQVPFFNHHHLHDPAVVAAANNNGIVGNDSLAMQHLMLQLNQQPHSTAPPAVINPSNQQQQQQQPSLPNIDSNPIKSLIMQMNLNKGHGPNHSAAPSSSSASSGSGIDKPNNNIGWMGTTPNVQQQQQQQQQLHHLMLQQQQQQQQHQDHHQQDVSGPIPGSSSNNNNVWDLSKLRAEMKTESQIIEEQQRQHQILLQLQRQQQQQQHLQELHNIHQLREQQHHHHQLQQQQQLQQIQQQEQQHQLHHQHQHQQQQQQQQHQHQHNNNNTHIENGNNNNNAKDKIPEGKDKDKEPIDVISDIWKQYKQYQQHDDLQQQQQQQQQKQHQMMQKLPSDAAVSSQTAAAPIPSNKQQQQQQKKIVSVSSLEGDKKKQGTAAAAAAVDEEKWSSVGRKKNQEPATVRGPKDRTSTDSPTISANKKSSNVINNVSATGSNADDKKRAKELKRQMEEEERRRQLDEEKRRQLAEDKKRLEDIAEQRRLKLMDVNRAQAAPMAPTNNQTLAAAFGVAQQKQQQQMLNHVGSHFNNAATTPSLAPWSASNPAGSHNAQPSLSLADIQKAERERRAEQCRVEQIMRDQQQTQMQLAAAEQKENTLKWNLQPQSVKSLAEIQAEEAKRQAALEREHTIQMMAVNSAAVPLANKKNDSASATAGLGLGPALGGGAGGGGSGGGATNTFGPGIASIWNNSSNATSTLWNSPKMWSNNNQQQSNNNNNAGGFWEDPTGGQSASFSQQSSNPAAAAASSAAVPKSVSARSTRSTPTANHGGFWEDPSSSSSQSTAFASVAAQSSNVPQKTVTIRSTAAYPKATLIKSQTVSNMQHAAAKSSAKQQQQQQQANNTKSLAKAVSSANVSAASNNATNAKASKSATTQKKSTASGDDSSQEFHQWCCKALASHSDNVDVPTFVAFLRDIESPFEVKDYVRLYLGESKDCGEFARQYLERRSKYKNQLRAANAHIDDMCQPAPAITPSSGNDFQEAKAKKEKKKNKMVKLDTRILGFSVTAAQDRLNVGDRDYGDAP